jgi:tetratricopeptide (TPR) repeat protein
MQQQLKRLQGFYDLQEVQSKSPQQLIRNGDELFFNGDVRKALLLYHQAIKILKKNPRDPILIEAYYKYATALNEIGEWKALDIYKNNVIRYGIKDSLYVNLAQAHIYFLDRQYKKALMLYKKVYQDHYASHPEDPNAIQIYGNIAKCLYEMQNYKQAQQYYKKITQYRQERYGFDSDYAKLAYTTMTKILLELEKYEEALPYIEKLLIANYSISWIYNYPVIHNYLSPIFEKVIKLMQQQYGAEDDRVFNIVELYIDTLFIIGDSKKAMEIINSYDADKIINYISMNQYTLPLFMNLIEKYFEKQDIDSLWRYAELLDRRNFYKESKMVWNMILKCREITEADILVVNANIKSLDSAIANEMIENLINGKSPPYKLQQIKKQDLIKFLSGKMKDLDKTLPKQKLLQIAQSFKQTSLDQYQKYSKLKLLGSGSFGKVWKVQDQQGHKYALKESLQDPQNLIYQSNLLKQVNKLDPAPTNLKYIQRTANDELVMQYLDEFVTLNDYLQSNSDRCKDIIITIKDLVKELHNKGISHRDLKGINIMIHPETEELRIIDFGVGCIKQSTEFPCQKFRGATRFYYPQRQKLTNFQDWKKADQKALRILEGQMCN